MKSMTELGKACIFYRARNRLTQAEMAEKCGLERTIIWKIEKGKHVSALTEAKVLIVIDGEGHDEQA